MLGAGLRNSHILRVRYNHWGLELPTQRRAVGLVRDHLRMLIGRAVRRSLMRQADRAHSASLRHCAARLLIGYVSGFNLGLGPVRRKESAVLDGISGPCIVVASD